MNSKTLNYLINGLSITTVVLGVVKDQLETKSKNRAMAKAVAKEVRRQMEKRK